MKVPKPLGSGKVTVKAKIDLIYDDVDGIVPVENKSGRRKKSTGEHFAPISITTLPFPIYPLPLAGLPRQQ
ncbi:MAG: hypothetical protein IJG40_01255 [Oscillospiraceae bacterium]|nr:hypothetical protein [Oscillospiraceae bacterium]